MNNWKLNVMEVLNCTSKLNKKECIIYYTLLKRVYRDSLRSFKNFLKKLIKIYNLNTFVLRLIENISNIIFSYEVSMI